MGYMPAFLHVEGSVAAGSETAPEFCRLLRQAVVLELQDQGVLDEEQCRRCLDALEKQVRDAAGQPDSPPDIETAQSRAEEEGFAHESCGLLPRLHRPGGSGQLL